MNRQISSLPVHPRDRFKLIERCNGLVLIPPNGRPERQSQEVYYLPADYYVERLNSNKLNGRHTCSFSRRDTFIVDSIALDSEGNMRIIARQVGGKRISFILKTDDKSPTYAIAIKKIEKTTKN